MDERDSAFYSNANTDSIYESIDGDDDGYSVGNITTHRNWNCNLWQLCKAFTDKILQHLYKMLSIQHQENKTVDNKESIFLL